MTIQRLLKNEYVLSLTQQQGVVQIELEQQQPLNKN
jgi:hypothetical protein